MRQLLLLLLLTVTWCSRSSLFSEAAGGWSFRWRSLNASSASSCQRELQPDLRSHFLEAMLDMTLLQGLSDSSADVPEICGISRLALHETSASGREDSVWINPHSQQEMQQQLQYRQLVGEAAQLKAIGGILSAVNFSSSASSRGKYSASTQTILTAGPSQFELADAVYKLLLHHKWTYVGIVSDASDFGAEQLVKILRDTAAADRRVCFPKVVSFDSSNVTAAAKSLKDFVYSEKDVPRLSVVYAGSASRFLELWQHVSGSSSAYADNHKRYQFVLVGDAVGVFHRMTDSSQKRNSALGTIFVFPSILDPSPASDELLTMFANLTDNPSSMRSFSSLTATHQRLLALRRSTDLLCDWSNTNSFCYELALNFHFDTLALIASVAHGAPSLTGAIQFNQLRVKEIEFPALTSKFTFLKPFTSAGFTKFSFAKGLYHSVNGYHQRIVKMLQSQLLGSRMSLTKVGEVKVRKMGQAGQTYEHEFGSTLFYTFPGGDPTALPQVAPSSASECPNSCTECLPTNSKQFIEHQEGDIYLGALIPVHLYGSDQYGCSDGTFRTKKVGGYEFAMAFKFIVKWANLVSEGATSFPAGFDESKMDENFMRGLKYLVEKVHERRTKRLRWGYVILDTCYTGAYAVRHLTNLLDGQLKLPNFDNSKIIGFVGALSSTLTIAASEVLKLYSIPLISYGSTSTALTNFELYPYVLRTVPSDTVTIESMVSVLKHYSVDFISVVFVPTAYGKSLLEEMVRIASNAGICIGQNFTYECSSDECRKNLILSIRSSGARYVPFLGDGGSFVKFLNYSGVESDLGYVTFLTTESVGTSDAAFIGRKNAGVGAVSVELISEASPGFSHYQNHLLTQLPPNANTISEWERLHFESVHQCYLVDSFVRNPLYTQPCTSGAVVSSTVTDLESRTPFVVDAVSTLVLGALTAMEYTCDVVTPSPACPKFLKSDFNSRRQRAYRIIYNKDSAGAADVPQKFYGAYKGVEWEYQKIFANRMGRPPLSLWQYRKSASTEYGYARIGTFDGSAGSFRFSRQQLFGSERQTASSGCRTRAACGSPSCSNGRLLGQSGGAGGGGGGGGGGELGLLGLLFFVGLGLGVLAAWLVWRRWFQQPQAREDYCMPATDTMPHSHSHSQSQSQSQSVQLAMRGSSGYAVAVVDSDATLQVRQQTQAPTPRRRNPAQPFVYADADSGTHEASFSSSSPGVHWNDDQRQQPVEQPEDGGAAEEQPAAEETEN